MGYVYILKCIRGKYYVGYTDNLHERLNDHFAGNGCAWTRRYSPIKVSKVYRNRTKRDETRITLKKMKKYGVHNVRGGPFVQMELPSDLDELMQRYSRHENDECFLCEQRGHYASECWLKENLSSDDDDDDEIEEEYSNFQERFALFSRSNSQSFSRKSSSNFDLICYYCDRRGHRSTECWEAPTCYRCGVRGHYATTCYR